MSLSGRSKRGGFSMLFFLSSFPFPSASPILPGLRWREAER